MKHRRIVRRFALLLFYHNESAMAHFTDVHQMATPSDVGINNYGDDRFIPRDAQLYYSYA